MPRSAPRSREWPVLVLGATGFTGGLVARELKRSGIRFGIAGRNGERLEALGRSLELDTAPRVVASWEPGGLEAAVSAARVVINCAGPFTDLGDPVVRACLEMGSHYLDTTGEQEFVHRMVVDHDREARDRCVTIVPSMAFEVALSDLAARWAGEGPGPLAEIGVYYLYRTDGMTPGTMASILRVTESRSLAVEGGKFVDREPLADTRTMSFPDGLPAAALSFPGAEVVTIPRHAPASRVQTYMCFPGVTGRLAALGAGFAPGAIRALVRTALSWRLRGAGPGPTAGQRERSTFRIMVEARSAEGPDGPGGVRVVSLEGRDPYGLTAAIITRAASRLLAQENPRHGVLAPAMAFDPRTFLAGLADTGLRVTGPDGAPGA